MICLIDQQAVVKRNIRNDLFDQQAVVKGNIRNDLFDGKQS